MLRTVSHNCFITMAEYSILTLYTVGVSKFLGTLSSSLRENISHVTAAAAVTSDGPEPVFDRMQVFVESGVLQFQFLCFLKFFIWYLSFPGTDCHSYCPSLELLHARSFS